MYPDKAKVFTEPFEHAIMRSYGRMYGPYLRVWTKSNDPDNWDYDVIADGEIVPTRSRGGTVTRQEANTIRSLPGVKKWLSETG